MHAYQDVTPREYGRWNDPDIGQNAAPPLSYLRVSRETTTRNAVIVLAQTVLRSVCAGTRREAGVHQQNPDNADEATRDNAQQPLMVASLASGVTVSILRATNGMPTLAETAVRTARPGGAGEQF